VCPFTPPLAFATQAVLAGVELRRRERVTRLERTGDRWLVETSRGTVAARWVVNATRSTGSPGATASR
jgi:glycerol-3-phosphate dehydrogenase